MLKIILKQNKILYIYLFILFSFYIMTTINLILDIHKNIQIQDILPDLNTIYVLSFFIYLYIDFIEWKSIKNTPLKLVLKFVNEKFIN